MKLYLRMLFSITLVTLLVSCGSASKGNKSSATTNYFLSYSKPEAVYFVNQTITPNLPAITPTKAVTSYTVDPVLPNGLLLDTDMGSISGSPRESSARTAYTITATTNGADLTATINIRVGYPDELNQAMIDYFEAMADVTGDTETVAAGIYDRDDDSLTFRAVLYPFSVGATELPFTIYNRVRDWGEAQGYSTFSSGQKGTDAAGDDTGDANMPITNVSFLSAIKTANAYSEMAGFEPVYYVDADSDGLYTASQDTEVFRSGTEIVMNYHANGFRLPTESEWEYACRSLLTDTNTDGATDFRKYFWGDTTPTDSTYGNWDFGDDDGETTWVSGSVVTAVNDFGLFDMMGNVREWVWDYSSSVSEYSAQTGDRLLPKGPLTGDKRVRRGGDYTVDAGDTEENKLQCSGHGSSLAASSSADSTGFRLVRSTTSEQRDLGQVADISYSQNQMTVTSITANLLFEIDPVYPVYNEGLFRSYTVSPDLPDGLILDPNTGQIFGAASEVDTPGTDYTITATSPAGQSSYTINIAVQIHPLVTSYLGDMVTATSAPIQAGIYLRDADTQKIMDVRLPAFKIHANELNYAVYEFVADWANSNGYSITDNGQRGSDASDNDTGDDTMPVTDVSWYSSILFANALSRLADLTPAYYLDSNADGVFTSTDTTEFVDETAGAVVFNLQAEGIRLPTETEWEYACRGITTDSNSDGATDYSLYPWGSTTLDDSLANLDSGTSGTIVSGSLAANPFGLYDMSGNVREWVWDYSSATSVYHRQFGSLGYHTGPLTGDKRVRRGGSHDQTTGDSEFFQCSSHGSSDQPDDSTHFTGLRVAQTIVDSSNVTGVSYYNDGTDTSGSTTVHIHQSVNIYPVISGGTAESFTISPTVPSGLTFDEGSGVISGSPTATVAAGDYTITINHSGGSTDYSLNLGVETVTDAAQSYINAMQSIITGSATTYSLYKRDDADAAQNEFIFSNTADPFLMGATEVSFRLYEQVRRYAEANGYDGFDDGLRGAYTPDGSTEISTGDEDMPVIANWDSAVLFSNALSEMNGLQPIYYKDDDGAGSPDDTFDANDTLVYRDTADVDYGSGDDLIMNFTATGYRLPTESEWEYGCRTQSAYLKYFWGNTDPTDLANANWDHNASDDDSTWVSGTGGASTMNSFGLYDTIGNVREWVWDWSSGSATYESQAGGTNFTGPLTGSNKVRRGGDFDYDDTSHYSFLQCSSHGSSEAPDDTSLSVATGFRIAVKEVIGRFFLPKKKSTTDTRFIPGVLLFYLILTVALSLLSM